MADPTKQANLGGRRNPQRKHLTASNWAKAVNDAKAAGLSRDFIKKAVGPNPEPLRK
jgi:hypothetical protein